MALRNRRRAGDARRARHAGRRGFSLIEVSIALGILAFGLLMVAVMQIQAIRQGSKGRHVYTAAMIGREQIEQIQRVPFTSLQTKAWGDGAAWMAGVGLTDGAVLHNVQNSGGGVSLEQTYNVAWQISAVPGASDLRNVELEVTWQELNARGVKPTRTGLPTVQLSTMVVNNSK